MRRAATRRFPVQATRRAGAAPIVEDASIGRPADVERHEARVEEVHGCQHAGELHPKGERAALDQHHPGLEVGVLHDPTQQIQQDERRPAHAAADHGGQQPEHHARQGEGAEVHGRFLQPDEDVGWRRRRPRGGCAPASLPQVP